jgi:hypothetical protein
MRLHYYKDPHGNFGDDLNPWLWSKLIPDLLDDDGRTLFVGIGTILRREIPRGPGKVVFGSGPVTASRPCSTNGGESPASVDRTQPRRSASRQKQQSPIRRSWCGLCSIPSRLASDSGPSSSLTTKAFIARRRKASASKMSRGRPGWSLSILGGSSA